MKFQDKSTYANARININYKGKNPKVKFSFPGDPKKSKPHPTFYCFLIAFITFIIFVTIGQIAIAFYEEYVMGPNLVEYNNCMNDYERNHQSICIEASRNNSLTYIRDKFGLKQMGDIKKELRVVIVSFTVLILLTILLRILIGKKIIDNYPKILATISSLDGVDHYKKTFKPDEIKKDEGRYFVEIPLFYNIKLDYKATKGFAKYLEEVEIKDHPFKSIKYEVFLTKKKKKKVQPNEWLWRARFYLSKKPRTGTLEVRFK